MLHGLYIRGEAIAPLSHRDMWLQGRAARLVRHANIACQRRHALDWLRIPMDEWCVDSDTDDEGLPDEDWSDLEGPSDDEEWFRNTPAHVRYVSNDELARRAARYMPGGDMYEP